MDSAKRTSISSNAPGAVRRAVAGLACLALLAGCARSVAAPGAIDEPAVGAQALAPADPGDGAALTATASGRWVAAGKLAGGRLSPKAVLLGDGRVLVVGDDGGSIEWGRSSAEVWAASTNRWQPTASLNNPRYLAVVVPLRNGRALVAGGRGESSGAHEWIPYQSYSSAWAYNPTVDGWARAGLMRQARTDPAAAVLRDGRVLVAGGYYASGDTAAGTSLERATGATAAVELVSSGPAVVADMDPGPMLPPAPVLRTAELYDPASDTWKATGPMAVARYGAVAVTLTDGRVLVVGQRYPVGDSHYSIRVDDRAFTQTEIYDPRTGRFGLAGALPAQAINASLVALADGGALLVGGQALDSGALPNRTTFRFDPKTNSWSASGQLATARTSAVAVRLRDGRVLVAGGFDAYGPTRTAELFDPATGTWSSVAPMPAPRARGTAVLLRDGSVLVVGGMGPHTHDFLSPPAGLATAVRFIPTP